MQVDFNLVSFVVSCTSLFMSLLTIWLSFKFRKEADEINKRTIDLLVDIRTDAKAISAFAIPELTKYGETGRQLMLGVTQNTQGNFQMTNISPTESEEHPNAGDR